MLSRPLPASLNFLTGPHGGFVRPRTSKDDGYAYIMPFRTWVNLGFFQGASMMDPQGLLEGTGARLRHVKLRTVADTEQPGVRALVEEACAERKAASR